MSRSAADYTAMLQSLLPSGRAWTRAPEAVLTALLAARAAGLAAVDAAADVLMLEADPRTAVQMLPAWERNFGLPLPGTGLAADLPTRQADVIAQMAFQPGASRAWWLERAALLGFPDAEIREHRPFRAGRSCAGQALATDPWRFRWEFVVYGQDGTPGAQTLRALLARYVQGHALVQLSFVDPDAALFAYDFLGGP